MRQSSRMRRWVLATAASFFTLGVIHAQRTDAVAQRLELQSEERKTRHAEPVVPSATAGRVVAHGDEPAIARRRRPARAAVRRYFGSKKSARTQVLLMFSAACSSASRHIPAFAGTSISWVSPAGVVNLTLPPVRK